MFATANRQFEGVLHVDADGMFIPPEARALTRMVARAFDAYDLSKAGHSSAI
jgi:oxygen-independent coproporphyrinogen-3 oxidase